MSADLIENDSLPTATQENGNENVGNNENFDDQKEIEEKRPTNEYEWHNDDLKSHYDMTVQQLQELDQQAALYEEKMMNSLKGKK